MVKLPAGMARRIDSNYQNFGRQRNIVVQPFYEINGAIVYGAPIIFTALDNNSRRPARHRRSMAPILEDRFHRRQDQEFSAEHSSSRDYRYNPQNSRHQVFQRIDEKAASIAMIRQQIRLKQEQAKLDWETMQRPRIQNPGIDSRVTASASHATIENPARGTNISTEGTKPQTYSKQYRIDSKDVLSAFKLYLKGVEPEQHKRFEAKITQPFTLKFNSEADHREFITTLRFKEPKIYAALFEGSETISLGLKQESKEVSKASSDLMVKAKDGDVIVDFSGNQTKAKFYRDLHTFLTVHQPEIDQELISISDSAGASRIKMPTGKALEDFKADLKLKNETLYYSLYTNEEPEPRISGELVLPDNLAYEQKVAARLKDIHESYKAATTEADKNKYASEIYLWTTTLNAITADRHSDKKEENPVLVKLLQEANLPKSFIDWATENNRIITNYREILSLVRKKSGESSDEELKQLLQGVERVDLTSPYLREALIKHTWATLAERIKNPEAYKDALGGSYLEGTRHLLDPQSLS